MERTRDLEATWYVLVVDDVQGVAEQTAELLNRTLNADSPTERILAMSVDSFDDALETLSRGGIDLLVLDVIQQGKTAPELEGELKGIDVFQQVRSRQFLPIVFLTARPNEVEDYKNPPFVYVVSKQAGDVNRELAQCISECLESPFPRISRRLQNHIDHVSRDFMIEFVEENWNELSDNEEDIAHLLMRRLGVSFDRGSDILAKVSDGSSPQPGKVPPIRYYIVPPPKDFRMGDILKRIGEGNGHGGTDQWRIIMTPSCDFSNNKVDSVILATCTTLDEFEEYSKWMHNSSENARDGIQRLLGGNPKGRQQGRYYYLPQAWKLPHLVVDLQKVLNIPYKDLQHYEKIASLDSPYSESLSQQFQHYIGRIGTPDLNVDLVIEQLKQP